MKLQEKTLYIFVILLISMLIGVSMFAALVVLSNYSTLEKQYVVKDLDQTVKKITDEENTLSALVSDWGPWDDSYNFVLGKKQNFVEANLVPDTFNNLRLNLVIITDTRGKIIYRGSYDLEKKTMVPVQDFFLNQISPGNPLMDVSDARHSTAGIMNTPTYPMIVASRPIVHTDFSGTPVGVVIMGRYLNADEINRLSDLTQPNLKVTRLDDPGFPKEILTRLEMSGGQNPTFVRPVSNDQIEGYTLIKDIYGQDAIILSFSEVRDIYQQGLRTTLNFILIILALGFLFGIVVIIILSKLVLSRLGALNLQVYAIARDNLLDNRIEIGGDDEFSGLAAQINKMLDVLKETQKGLQLSETRFRELAELLPQIVFEMDLDGKLLYVNQAGVDKFGVTQQKIADGVNIRAYVNPQNYDQMQRGLAAVIAGGKSPGQTYSLLQSNGELMQALVTTSLIVRDGKLIGFRGVVVDITERKRLKDQLGETAKLLNGILQASPVGVFRLDSQGHVVFVNQTFSVITGISSEDIKGKYWADILAPDDKQRLLTDLGDAIREKKMMGSETRYFHPDGTVHWLFGQTVPIFNSVGILNGWVGTVTDITERKKIEDELKESRVYLETLVSSIQVGLLVIDAETHRIVDANSAALALIGVSKPDLIGKNCHNFICQAEHGKCPVTDLGKDVDNSERFLINATGEEIPIIKYVVPVMLNGRRCLLETFIDNSYRKKIEMALKESEEKYRALTENTPDVLFSTDINGVLTYVSPQVNQYGFLSEELIGKPLFNFIHLEDRQRILDTFTNELAEGAQFTATFRILDKWENIIWFEERSFLRLDQFGKPSGVYGMLRDVTEHKKAEDAIELANKKLNLMNNITRHDILNTITGLLGCVDMANATESPEEKTTLLNDIKELTRVIQRQINFTKEYQEVGVHLPKWQDVGKEVREVLQNFELSGIVFVVDLDNVEIYADPLLEKVFYNLIDNAIRYGKTLRTIKFYIQISDKGLSLICEDDGIGIIQGYKHYIFERGVGQNTGMGLFLSREILGITRIEIEENGIPGEGARFEMVIPRGTFRFSR